MNLYNNNNQEKTFLEHLQDLRKHLIRITIVLIILSIIAFIRKDIIFDKILLAPKNPEFPIYKLLCRISEITNIPELCIKNTTFVIQNIDISGQFTAHIWASIVAGFIVGFPYFIWELWLFVLPALTTYERKSLKNFIAVISLLFILGILFGYYVLVPLTVTFLGTYQVSAEIINQITLSSYISVVTTTTLLTGLLFELPVITFFLAKMGIINSHFMKKYRRHAIVLIFIIAAIITPSTDMLSQTLISLPLLALYELSIIVVNKTSSKNLSG